MAVTSVLKDRMLLSPGLILERHTWVGVGTDTTGTISPNTTDAEGIGKIAKIVMASATDDDNAVRIEYNNYEKPTVVSLFFTASDNGDLTIIGVAE